MFAETDKRGRIAFSLLCGLAVCCTVMYLSSDASADFVHEGNNLGDFNSDQPGTSVESMDVLKAGEIYSETTRSKREKLSDYFNFIEETIATEVSERKADIATVRATMAKDFAFNAAQRGKLQKDMLHKMAVNAKIARDDLNKAMRKTQERFAKQAKVANRRYKATLKRAKQTQATINDDKRRAARALKLATSAWQKSTTAWAASTNSRIDRLNAHAAANAAQIKENAVKAKKDLEVTMGAWDHRVRTFASDSKTARTKLGAQFAQQDKATRSWANNKIKGLVAATAAQFDDVETKMAKNRQEVDEALKKATMRFTAALGAAEALESKRFAENEANIEQMKAETKAKVEEASSQFKVSLLSLSSEVKTQVQKVNTRIDGAAGVVRSDAAAQAKINANVNAEMTRMVKLGNDRYKSQLDASNELHASIDDAKTKTDAKLTAMAADFNGKLAAVRKTLADDRLHAETKLQKQTQAVFAKLSEQAEAQATKNKAMKGATTRMKLDAIDAIRTAKEDFMKQIKDLGEVVTANDKKADGQIKKLTGVVTANAQKSAEGRQVLFNLEKANKNELHTAIEGAIAKGEKRAQAAEAKASKMDKKTRQLVNTRLNAEITKLRDHTNSQVEGLQLETKEARAEMRKEMLLAIRGAAETAKSDLESAIKDAATRMEDYEKKHADTHADSKLAREALTEEIRTNAGETAQMLKDAVAADAKAQLALGTMMAGDIKATNKAADAYAKQMADIASKSRDDIKAQADKVISQLEDQKQETDKNVKTLGAEDVARQKAVINFLESELKKAGDESEEKFGKAYQKLAEDRSHAATALNDMTKAINSALAKQAALEDSRFRDTVTNIDQARKAAAQEVLQLRKGFATALVETTAIAKRVESKLTGMIEVVSGEVISIKAHQVRVRKRVDAELERIEKIANERFTENKKARGQIKFLLDENKGAAADEVSTLETSLREKLSKARAANAANKIEVAKALTDASETFYEKLGAQAKANDDATKAANDATTAAKAKSAGQLAAAEAMFESKIIALANTVSENSARAKRKLTAITGVVNDYNAADEAEQELIKGNIVSLEADLNKAMDRAIQLGEAKAKAVEQRIAAKLKGTKTYLMVQLTESCERSADTVFAAIETHRKTIADNYMSLKAYAVAAKDGIEEYISKGKGAGLSAIGDLLETAGSLSSLQCKPAEGLGMGGDKVPAIFSGKTVGVTKSLNVVNCLVNEYTDIIDQVHMRWSMGIGSYLLNKLEMSMIKKGVLQVSDIEDKPGKYVFINGNSIGLSNKMSDFTSLAAKMSDYETALAHLTAKITLPAPKVEQQQLFVSKQEAEGGPWPGN